MDPYMGIATEGGGEYGTEPYNIVVAFYPQGVPEVLEVSGDTKVKRNAYSAAYRLATVLVGKAHCNA